MLVEKTGTRWIMFLITIKIGQRLPVLILSCLQSKDRSIFPPERKMSGFAYKQNLSVFMWTSPKMTNKMWAKSKENIFGPWAQNLVDIFFVSLLFKHSVSKIKNYRFWRVVRIGPRNSCRNSLCSWKKSNLKKKY